MKKVTAILLVLMMAFGLAGCGETAETAAPSGTVSDETPAESTEDAGKEIDPYAVATPTVYKTYAFDHEPTVEELRETAIQAQHDMLSIEWYSPVRIAFHKNNRDYVFEPYTHYAGLIYGTAQANLYGWLEYYDQETGRVDVETIQGKQVDVGSVFNMTMGNTCSGSTCWSWFTVVNTISGKCVDYELVALNGFLPVAPCTYDPALPSFQEKTTIEICAENGAETLYRAYANMHKADLLVYQWTEDAMGGHSIMVIEEPHVEYTESGEIDPEKSYLVIQDQRQGGYEGLDAKGQKLYYSGRVRYQQSFQETFDDSYLPVTNEIFLGEKTYEAPSASLNGEAKSLDDLSKLRVKSNYPLSLVKAVVTDKNGRTDRAYLNVFGRDDIGNKEAMNFKLNRVPTYVKKSDCWTEGATVEVIAVLSNGVEEVLYSGTCGE